MFDSIAGDYDSLNHILSLDVDKIWRKKALKRIVDVPAPLRVLDLACGHWGLLYRHRQGFGSVVSTGSTTTCLRGH